MISVPLFNLYYMCTSLIYLYMNYCKIFFL